MAHATANDRRPVIKRQHSLTGAEAERARLLFEASADIKWANRIRVTLSGEFFLQHTFRYLSEKGVKYRRFAFESRNEVWYLFRDPRDVLSLFEALDTVPDELRTESVAAND